MSSTLEKYIYSMKSDPIYVVEGRHDAAKLKQVDRTLQIFVTHGAHFSTQHLDHLIQLAKTHPIILMLDPDGAGARIQKRILEAIPQCDAIHVARSQATRKDGKIGIEHMSSEALKQYITRGPKPKVTRETWNQETLIRYGLSGDAQSKKYRQRLAEAHSIPYTNAKHFADILNRYNITESMLKEVLNET